MIHTCLSGPLFLWEPPSKGSIGNRLKTGLIPLKHTSWISNEESFSKNSLFMWQIHGGGLKGEIDEMWRIVPKQMLAYSPLLSAQHERCRKLQPRFPPWFSTRIGWPQLLEDLQQTRGEQNHEWKPMGTRGNIFLTKDFEIDLCSGWLAHFVVSCAEINAWMMPRYILNDKIASFHHFLSRWQYIILKWRKNKVHIKNHCLGKDYQEGWNFSQLVPLLRRRGALW